MDEESIILKLSKVKIMATDKNGDAKILGEIDTSLPINGLFQPNGDLVKEIDLIIEDKRYSGKLESFRIDREYTHDINRNTFEPMYPQEVTLELSVFRKEKEELEE